MGHISLLKAQLPQSFGLKFFGLSIHAYGDENWRLMPRRLDDTGRFVINLGATANYELFVWRDIVSVKSSVALYSDCAARLGGFFHVGLRGRIFKIGRHTLNGGIGPTLIFRRNWAELPNYSNLHYFKGAPGDIWQWRFLWYGGEFEYNVQLWKGWEASLTFIPGFPKLMSLSIGFRYCWNKK